MRLSFYIRLFPLLLFLWTSLALGQAPHGAAAIDSGEYLPFFSAKEGVEPTKIVVERFYIDRHPVTVRAFFDFVRKHPDWSKAHVSPLKADHLYLSIDVNGTGDFPITRVSWFAARAYCKSIGARLPTIAEWEYVAAASATKKDAARDPEFVQQILDWYGTPNKLRPVGTSQPNAWGVYDLHGLIWEWSEDFNSVFVAGDNRRDGEANKNLFCGAGAVGSAERANYAAFMRFAVRSSLQGSYTMENLGFRCAYDWQKEGLEHD